MRELIRTPASNRSLGTRKAILGVGINDAEYMTDPRDKDGKQTTRCPHYQTWKSMLERCYSDKYQQRQPTYIGCSVSEEWHVFSAFLAWNEKQEWEGMCLDKDILIMGNKEYSPSTCCYVSGDINKFFSDSGAARGDLPLGVSLFKGKYKVSIRIASKRKHLGYFELTDLEGAVSAYKVAKLARAYVVAEDITDEQVKAAFIDQAICRFGTQL